MANHYLIYIIYRGTKFYGTPYMFMYEFNYWLVSVCDDGAYVSNGQCTKCPGFCKDGAPCNKSTGMCDNGCSMHMTGQFCEGAYVWKLSNENDMRLHWAKC